MSISKLFRTRAKYFVREVLWIETQPDTEIPDFSNPQSYNRYSYCINDPLRYNDPTGHGADDGADDDNNPTAHLSLTLGGNHAAERQSLSTASAQLYNQSKVDFRNVAVTAKAAAEMNPVISGTEAISGKDIVSNEKLTGGQRLLAAGGAVPGMSLEADAAKASKAAFGVLTVGEAANQVEKLKDLDILVGFVKDGKILGQVKLSDDVASAMSHEKLASQLGVLTGKGKLAEDVEAFTAVKQKGQVLIRGSNNFDPNVTEATAALLKEKFQ